MMFKGNRKFLLCIAIASLMTVLINTGCEKDNIKGNEQKNQQKSVNNKEFSKEVNDKSYEIFSNILKENGYDDNLVISPISIQRALDIVSKMTSERDGIELLKMYDSGSLLDYKFNNSKTESLVLVNKDSIGSKKVNKIVPEVKITEFPKEAILETESLQKRVLGEVIYTPKYDNNPAAVVVDAIRYYSKWLYEFPEDNTKEMPFISESGEEISVDTMNSTFSDSKALVRDDVEVFSMLAYKDAKAYFIKPKIDKNEVADNLSKIIDDYEKDDKLYDVNFSLPKAKVKNSIDLDGVINSLNLGKLLSGFKADKLVDGLNLNIGNALQVAEIEVDEKGAEAKAVTVLETMSAPPPKDSETVEVKMNSPYFIVITDRVEGSGDDYVVFTTYIANPKS